MQQIFSINIGDRIIETNVLKTEFCVVSNCDEKASELIIKAVNISCGPKKAKISKSGVENISDNGKAIIFKSKEPSDENSYLELEMVSPYTKFFNGISKEFVYEFDVHAVTILRLKIIINKSR